MSASREITGGNRIWGVPDQVCHVVLGSNPKLIGCRGSSDPRLADQHPDAYAQPVPIESTGAITPKSSNLAMPRLPPAHPRSMKAGHPRRVVEEDRPDTPPPDTPGLLVTSMDTVHAAIIPPRDRVESATSHTSDTLGLTLTPQLPVPGVAEYWERPPTPIPSPDHPSDQACSEQPHHTSHDLPQVINQYAPPWSEPSDVQPTTITDQPVAQVDTARSDCSSTPSCGQPRRTSRDAKLAPILVIPNPELKGASLSNSPLRPTSKPTTPMKPPSVSYSDLDDICSDLPEETDDMDYGPGTPRGANGNRAETEVAGEYSSEFSQNHGMDNRSGPEPHACNVGMGFMIGSRIIGMPTSSRLDHQHWSPAAPLPVAAFNDQAESDGAMVSAVNVGMEQAVQVERQSTVDAKPDIAPGSK
jgi:hypothetical protein